MVAALLILAVGLVAINHMSTEVSPEINVPVVGVVRQYTGMPADSFDSPTACAIVALSRFLAEWGRREGRKF